MAPVSLWCLIRIWRQLLCYVHAVCMRSSHSPVQLGVHYHRESFVMKTLLKIHFQTVAVMSGDCASVLTMQVASVCPSGITKLNQRRRLMVVRSFVRGALALIRHSFSRAPFACTV